MCLTNSGKIYTWGKGTRDMRDKSALDDYYIPRDPFDSIKFRGCDFFFSRIAGGYTHIGAITDSGELYMWGESSHGCLGRPPSEMAANKRRIISHIPTEVDFFLDKKVM